MGFSLEFPRKLARETAVFLSPPPGLIERLRFLHRQEASRKSDRARIAREEGAHKTLFSCRSAERADHDPTSAAQGLGEGEPRESSAHLLERAVNPPGSNPGQRRDRLLDAIGRDPSQTHAIVGAWLHQ